MVEFSFLTGLIAGNLNTYIFGGMGYLVGLFLLIVFMVAVYRMGAGLGVVVVVLFPLIGLLYSSSLLPKALWLGAIGIAAVAVFFGLIRVGQGR